MGIDKILPTKLLWMDLEFTDFEYSKAQVLEVAVEVTDFNFVTLGSYEARIKNDAKKLVERLGKNTFWQEHRENRDMFIAENDKGKPLAVVENELIEFINQHFGNEPAILAGNSIHSDRSMIKAAWPLLDLKLHYRMLDVSSWKIVMQGKYSTEYDKNNGHRAYDDIQESIAELQYYLDWFKKGEG